MILSLDPSYTSTGICLLDGGLGYVAGTHFASGEDVYKPFGSFYKACNKVIDRVGEFIARECVLSGRCAAGDLDVVVETPALATHSGAYLGVLSGVLCRYFLELGVRTLTFVPPTACNSYIRNKERTKSYIVAYCKGNGWVPDIRVNHDVCTAVVLGHVLGDIFSGGYRNSYIRVKDAG